ncbi:MAG: glycosyltransferase [Candidatus Promineifilaceae bacterium]
MSELSDSEPRQNDKSPGSIPQISIIIPTRNESENIRPLLLRLTETLSDFDIEIIFVDDSDDGTADVITSNSDLFPFPIRLIARPTPQRNGLSGAVVDGFAAVEGEWVCVMDADLQHPPETIPVMWEQAQKTGADIVVGSRSGDLFGPYGLSRLRSLNSKILTIVARTVFPRRLKNVADPLTGLFLVRSAEVDVAALRPDGFKILLEILVRNPGLQVSEVNFQFEPRHSGESKADVREGGRFFRHLITLRSTANPHLGRFLVVIVLSLIGNAALFSALTAWGKFSPVISAFLTAELIWLAIFFALDLWVFSEQDSAGRKRRFWGYFILTQFGVFAVYLPIFFLFTSLLKTSLMTANMAAFIIVGLVRYLLSEQWVWTRGAIAWQAQSHFYNLHDLLFIESQVPLRELEDYQAAPSPADIHIRVDRQGTPTVLPGGISYDDQLGRFGFGISVLPGEYTQVVVSPLLEHSPDFLYTNIIEPILRWRLVQKGYAMLNAACVAKGNQASLIIGDQDLGWVVSRLCENYNYAFLADDLTIVDREGWVYSYTKPLTVNRLMINESSSTLSLQERLALGAQKLLYTPFVRQVGLWLSARHLPAATFNTYLQRFVPQPKQHLQQLFSGTVLMEKAELVEIIWAVDPSKIGVAGQAIVARLQQNETVAAFQPHPLLAQKLQTWGGENLVLKEWEIIESAAGSLPVHYVDPLKEEWWLLVSSDGSSQPETVQDETSIQ